MSLSNATIVVTLALSLAAVGCKKERATKKLPAASDWQASPMASSGGSSAGAGAATGNPHGATAGGDPHAGMTGMNEGAGAGAAGGDPHAGMDMGAGDPHAGMDMGAGDPHAGMTGMNAGAAGGDPMEGVVPPDPNRPIDESQFLKGSLVTTAETRDLIKAGAIIFIHVKPIEPVTGETIGDIIAVDRIDVTTMPVSFQLSGRNAMSAGTNFSGDVIIYARVDGDGEARTRTPGDVEGSTRAKIPADNLELKLDTILR